MNKLYKLVVFFLVLTAMNFNLQAQERTTSEVLPKSKAFIQDISFSNYPNPASSQTTISYNLAVKSKVSLKLVDLTGRQLAVLVNQDQAAGIQQPVLDFKKYNITSGMYILILRVENKNYSRKVIVQ